MYKTPIWKGVCLRFSTVTMRKVCWDWTSKMLAATAAMRVSQASIILNMLHFVKGINSRWIPKLRKENTVNLTKGTRWIELCASWVEWYPSGMGTTKSIISKAQRAIYYNLLNWTFSVMMNRRRNTIIFKVSNLSKLDQALAAPMFNIYAPFMEFDSVWLRKYNINEWIKIQSIVVNLM